MPVVVGVDSSTQSCKVEVRDADDGSVLGGGQAPHPATTPPRSEQDPAAWWGALAAATAEAGATAATRGVRLDRDVIGISIAGQQHGMVALDAGGEVLRPAKLWNDTESADESARLVAELGATRWAEACGSVPVASFTITKLAWLRTHEPDTFDRLGMVLLPHDWLTAELTGSLLTTDRATTDRATTDRATTDRGEASGTGYWSPGESRWRTDLLDLVGPAPGGDWSALLPHVLGPTDTAGEVCGPAARLLGLPAGIPVGPGTGDNMAAALGVGLTPGDLALSLGTSGTVFAVHPTATADASGAVAGFADATGRFLPLVCTLNATRVTDTVARLLGVDHRTFDDLARAGRAGAGGLVLVPYLDGERTPNRPTATGTLDGLRTTTTREDLARAAVEGVVCGLLDGIDALAAVGVGHGPGGRVLLVGGGARSAAFREVLASLLGHPVLTPIGGEHVVAGAAAQAAAVARGSQPESVAAEWGLGHGPATDPDLSVDGPDIRAAYAAARDLERH